MSAERSATYRRRHAAKIAAYKVEYAEANRAKRSAHFVVQAALRVGRLTRPDHCERCSAPCVPHGHHADYSKPLEVLWVCHPCHMKEHNRPLVGRPVRGEAVGGAKLNADKVREIRAMIEQGIGHDELAAKYGVSRGAVWFIATRKTWKHV